MKYIMMTVNNLWVKMRIKTCYVIYCNHNYPHYYCNQLHRWVSSSTHAIKAEEEREREKGELTTCYFSSSLRDRCSELSDPLHTENMMLGRYTDEIRRIVLTKTVKKYLFIFWNSCFVFGTCVGFAVIRLGIITGSFLFIY